MKMLRNPEIQRSLLCHLILAALAVSLGFFYDLTTGAILLLFSALYIAVHYFFTGMRYRKLRNLSQELDEMLHSNTPIQFEKYREGELSILESELSKMTLRLREQALALTNEKKLLADSMADISHQIRSPLTSSNLIITLLRGQNLSVSRRQQLTQELSQLLSRIDWLVESLLKISKMDAGTILFKHEPVSVPQLIQHAAEPLLIPMELREQTLAIDSSSPSSATPQFLGDYSWSMEAILNILKNCMEHTPAGGSIHVSFSQNAIFTEIIIEDNGPGFDAEDLPHLFERFYKGKNASEQSVGIGLALARMIVTRQNGTLKAENRSEGGARFILKFYA
ncbi:MAG: HAMP domain-containing histidine kinase [Lachnospiraceae bacterium]|nr:HAMP domain-containing histidine kinase [Lachnospiraceae bacterium]